MNTPEEIDKTADLVRAVTAKLTGPQVIWLVHCDNDAGDNFYAFSAEALARAWWKSVLLDEEKNTADLDWAIGEIDGGSTGFEYPNACWWSLSELTLDQ